MTDRPLVPGVQEAVEDDRLDSWKAIAAYLKRDVSTVQRWEKRERLPIHRHSKGGSVYAFRSELDAWWRRDGQHLQGEGVGIPVAAATRHHRFGSRALLLAAGATALVAASFLTAQRRSVRPVLRSLAVLPLANYTGDARQDDFVDGMTEVLTAELGLLEGMRVISRQTMMRYKGTTKATPEIAREVAADGIVQGSVARSGDRVRISVALIEGATDRHLWAGTFETLTKDVLAVHRDVARTMGAEMRLATLAGQRPPPLPSLPAYEHYLRGRVHCRRWTTEEFRKGVAELEAGIALAPAYAPAYATLAACYGSAAMFGHQPPAELRLVRRAAVAKALELAPNSGESHRVAAGAAFREDWDWSRAEVAFRQAISLEPNNAPARQGYAWYLAAMGRFAEAREQVDEARRIDPVSVPHLLASGTVALFSGAFDQAAEECRKAVGLDPGNSVSRAYLGWALVLKGHHKQALEELETANRLSAGDPFTASMLAYGYGRAGRVAAARQVLDDLGALARQRYVSAFYAALVHTALEEPDAALSRLEKAFEERNAWLVWLKVDQRLDPLRARPRFQALLGRMQFPGSTDPPRHSIRAEHE